MSVDGTDFRIQEPVLYSPKWYSHKFKGSGLRYEVRVGVYNENVVWARGSFPCGSYGDLRIYRSCMKSCLAQGERVIADGGYNDASCSYPLSGHGGLQFGYSRARHEVVNKPLKQIGLLGNRFRRRLSIHSLYTFAVINAAQLSIEKGEAIFTQYG